MDNPETLATLDTQDTGQRQTLGTPVSSTIKTDRHDITEILLIVALSTINQTNHVGCDDKF